VNNITFCLYSGIKERKKEKINKKEKKKEKHKTLTQQKDMFSNIRLFFFFSPINNLC